MFSQCIVSPPIYLLRDINRNYIRNLCAVHPKFSCKSGLVPADRANSLPFVSMTTQLSFLDFHIFGSVFRPFSGVFSQFYFHRSLLWIRIFQLCNFTIFFGDFGISPIALWLKSLFFPQDPPWRSSSPFSFFCRWWRSFSTSPPLPDPLSDSIKPTTKFDFPKMVVKWDQMHLIIRNSRLQCSQNVFQSPLFLILPFFINPFS